MDQNDLYLFKSVSLVESISLKLRCYIAYEGLRAWFRISLLLGMSAGLPGRTLVCAQQCRQKVTCCLPAVGSMTLAIRILVYHTTTQQGVHPVLHAEATLKRETIAKNAS